MRAPLHKSESVESYKSESDGDPDHDIRKLTDWEGKWLPAPVEWEGRRGFSDKNSYQTIDAWVTRTVKACRDIIDVTAAEFKAHENGDIAPRSWIPLAIEAESPQGFWRTLQSRAPAALSDIGPEEMPWWEKYISPLGDHMAHINQPHSIMERQDPGYAPCQRDDGSVGASKRHLQIKNQKYEKAAEKRKRQMEASAEAIATYGEIPEPPDTRLKPTANIFVRPANVTDMDQVKEIYNHYVRHTIHSPEYNPRAQAHMVTRMTDILNAKLPFLVAVDRSSKGNKNGEVGQITHRIVGFADADDYCHPGSMYRFTVELELFVHPDYLRKGIGSCLLDKMLSLLDNGRAALGGYDWIAPRTYGTDGMRVVKSVNVNLPYDSRNRQSSERTEEWLYKFGFKARGRLENMGYKNNTVVNLAIYQFITTEWIDPRQWPSNPL
jgi:L-amino acid N-acyltransferase YncA